jgi:hypothetical protein
LTHTTIDSHQEARGSGIKKGQHYYVENIREELDEAGEWFYDEDAQKMYVWPNVTGSMDGMGDVVVPLLDSIVRIEGTPSSSSSSSTDPMSKGDPTTASYATDISFTGFEFTETRATFLEQYEVPSGAAYSCTACWYSPMHSCTVCWYSPMHSYTALIHCTHTLHSYTALIHCTHTLHSYTALIHCTHTLHSYTVLIH